MCIRDSSGAASGTGGRAGAVATGGGGGGTAVTGGGLELAELDPPPQEARARLAMKTQKLDRSLVLCVMENPVAKL